VRTGPPLRTTSAAGLTAVLLLATAGVAFAAWGFGGSGSSAARAATALGPTATSVAGSAVTTGLLYPTRTGTVVMTVANPNPYRVKVSSVTANGSATGSGGVGSCSTTGVTMTTQSPGTLVPAGGSATLTLVDGAAMSAAADSGCQGAVFTIPVTVTVESA
jgi:hypothetical protein